MLAIFKKFGLQLLVSAFYACACHGANADAISGSEVSAPIGNGHDQLVFSSNAQPFQEPSLAEQDKLCVVIRPQPGQVMVWQHRFEDGSFDLAVAQWRHDHVDKITRLSFKGSKQSTCHFPAIAIIKGGDWGWHIAWSSNSSTKAGVYYARLDGDAWVSSLPKKISVQTADTVELNEQAGILVLRYTASHMHDANVVMVRSDDEGRSWEVAPTTPQ